MSQSASSAARPDPVPALARQAKTPDVRPVVALTWGFLLYTALRAIQGSVPAFDQQPFALLKAIAPVCLLKSLAHLPCPLCGMTRSVTLIAQGRWMESLQYHPLGLPTLLLMLLVAVSGLAQPALPARLLVFLTHRRALGLLGVLFGGAWLWKLSQRQAFW